MVCPIAPLQFADSFPTLLYSGSGTSVCVGEERMRRDFDFVRLKRLDRTAEKIIPFQSGKYVYLPLKKCLFLNGAVEKGAKP